jgi:cytochrome bd-type quinol oxidase subunit 2
MLQFRRERMDRHPNILNAASNLLGICFLIIAGLSLTKSNSRSFADEIAWVAAVSFLASIALAYIAIRNRDEEAWQAIWSDRIFMVGVGALTLSTLVVGFALR